MAVRLRTRLFLIVAALLGASIVASALLSRRATLVEVRAVVSKGPAIEDVSPVLDRAAATIARTAAADLSAPLAVIERDTSRPVLVGTADGTVVAASNPSLAAARVRELRPDGRIIAEMGVAGAQSLLEIHGAPARQLSTTDGVSVIAIVLPALERDQPPPMRQGTPLWVWTTIATGIIAVPLVFAAARRILDPISALTHAARRLQAGDLDARVDVKGRDELAELAGAFNGMAARIADTERLRRQMVSDIAHELRSPVTNLRCTLESIQDGLAPPDRASLDALLDETLLLQRLIADLQDLTLADAGQLTLRVAPVDLHAVLRRAAVPPRGTSGPELHLDVAENLPRVRGDADRLEQVFRNLLANARTHTPADGRIEISAGRAAGGVRIVVADNGRGIAAEHLEHVFDRFYRADRSRSRVTGGAGLGLAIVRQLVTAHGGTVAAESDGAGRGTRFTVTLPAEAG